MYAFQAVQKCVKLVESELKDTAVEYVHVCNYKNWLRREDDLSEACYFLHKLFSEMREIQDYFRRSVNFPKGKKGAYPAAQLSGQLGRGGPTSKCRLKRFSTPLAFAQTSAKCVRKK